MNLSADGVAGLAFDHRVYALVVDESGGRVADPQVTLHGQGRQASLGLADGKEGQDHRGSANLAPRSTQWWASPKGGHRNPYGQRTSSGAAAQPTSLPNWLRSSGIARPGWNWTRFMALTYFP